MSRAPGTSPYLQISPNKPAQPIRVADMFKLVKAMPDGTYLTSIKETGTKLKFEGIAQSSTRVSTLMRNISASQWLRNPELEVVETAKDNTGGSHEEPRRLPELSQVVCRARTCRQRR